jgi:carbon-monoxide dehydrogenase large subunit
MLHAAFVRSPVARGVIKSIDITSVSEMSGVRAVYLADDLSAPEGSFTSSLFPPGSPRAPHRTLARDDVRYVGEPLALLIADNRYLAADALDLVSVDIEPLSALVDYEDAPTSDVIVHPELGTNLAASGKSPPDPELDQVLATAAHVVSVTLRQHRQTNAPMEPRGIIADWEPIEGRLHVHVSSQSPHEVRDVMARALGIDEGRVRVTQGDVGGGFGQKMLMGREEILVALAAKKLGRSVKWIETRNENLMASSSARIGRVTVTFALDDRGVIQGAVVDHLEDLGACPAGIAGGTANQVCRIFPGPYRIPRYGWRTASVWTNTVGRGAYRGPWMIETVAREQAIDHVARAIGLDPLDLRKRNVIRPEDLPHTTGGGYTYDTVSPAECLEQAASILDYEAARKEQAEQAARGRYLGIGISTFIEPTGRGTSKLGTEAATVRISPSGAVDVYLGTGAHGQSIETTIAQVVADELGVDYEAVTVHQGDTDASPLGAGTGGSRTAVLVGGAARASSRVVHDRLRGLAGHILEASPEDIEIAGGEAWVRGVPSRRLSFADLGRLAYLQPEHLPPELGPGIEATERYKAPPVTWSNAAHMCLVEVDIETGRVEILRYVVSEDCGVMINPMVVEGQVSGGVAQGIGGVLYEHLAYDPDGNPLATTLMDYLVPTATEIPNIEIGHLETPSLVPGGHKGMGEGGAIGSVPCVANAVADALSPLGVTVTSQPLGPGEIFALLHGASTQL